jgi:drug/metabolite transporter (DMT)-like permease
LVIGITSFFGQIWLTRAFQHGQASFISAVGYIDPVFCWVLGLVLFDEKMTTSAAIGATIILASGIILTHFAQKK